MWAARQKHSLGVNTASKDPLHGWMRITTLIRLTSSTLSLSQGFDWFPALTAQASCIRRIKSVHVPCDHLVTDVLATTSSSSSNSQPQHVVLHQPLCVCQSSCCFWPHTLSADGTWQKGYMPPPMWFGDHTSQWDLVSNNLPFPRHWESFISCPLPLSCTSRRQENLINLRAVLMNQRERWERF